MSVRLSENDVIARLFEPSKNLPDRKKDPAMVVAITGVEHTVTHKQIENLIANALQQLKARNIGEDDNVVFFCENGVEFTPTLLACWALKATATLVDFRMELPKALAICKRLGAKLLLTSRAHGKLVSQPELIPGMHLDVMDISKLENLKDTEVDNPFDLTSLDLNRHGLMLLTSGTTGAPKSSLHTLKTVMQNIIDLANATGLKAGMTAVSPLPTSHIFGLSVLLVTQVLGMKTVLTSLDPVAFIKAVHYHKPDMIAALPQFYGALMSAPDGVVKLDNTELLLCGGAPLTVSLADKFEKKFAKRLNNGYGSTESKIVAFNQNGPVLSVGKPIEGVLIDIVDDQHQPVSEGESGEVRIKAPTFMSAYLNNADETRKVLESGYYYTGDYGRIEKGHVFVAGRKSDVIIVGGVVVQAGEIEELLRSCPEVKEVAVTAVANKRLGQIIKASVVLLDEDVSENLKSTDPAKRVEAELAMQRKFKAICNEHLSRFKRPSKWVFYGLHDDLPKTLAGKIDKSAL